jgi:folate-dependent phosphoribosylglycinamide formyltransferase PurN
LGMTRVVFFTNKAARGAHILREMKSRNISVEAIFIDVQRPTGLKAKFQKMKRLGPIGTLKIISKRVRKTLAPMESKMISRRLQRKLAPGTAEEWFSNDFYQSYSDKVHIVNDFNAQKCEQLLKEIDPDVIVLGGSRIIRKNIINIPKVGILNAHLGLLPKYRGVDVIPWAIYNGDDIGVTVHFVDEGIDTGGIVVQKVIDVTESDTIDSLGKKANMLAGELMAETVLKIVEGEHIQVMPQSKEDGKQFYRMPMKLFRETERKLRTMIGGSEHSSNEASPHG